MEEREAAAKQMLEMEPQDCPVFLDKLDNAANRVFAALPERLYIINRGTVVYKGGQGPFKYSVSRPNAIVNILAASLEAYIHDR